jgi:hypothetical protein
VTIEPDRWLRPVRRGLLLAGSALSLRWFLAVVWIGAQRAFVDGAADAGRALLAVQFFVDAGLAAATAVGVFWLTSRAVPHVPTRRWPLRTLALADLGFTLARAVSLSAFGGFEGGALTALLQVAAAIALLARLADVCDAGHERVAATWARSGAVFLALMTLMVTLFALVPGAVLTTPLLLTWSTGMVGLAALSTVATLRAARWM